MIGTEESNNESMIINAGSIICDKNKQIKYNFFSEQCFKLCSYENGKTGVKCGLKTNKRQEISKLNKSNYHLQKTICSIHEY